MDNKRRVLERVEDDLARGHTHIAVQRLTTLVQSDPGDLDLRRRLGAIHHATGNWVEAGRWSYLDPGRDEEAVAAFDRAFPNPRSRLHALRVTPDLELAVPVDVRVRLESLRELALSAPANRDPWVTLRRVSPVLGVTRRATFVAFVLVNVGAYVVGCIALVRWFI